MGWKMFDVIALEFLNRLMKYCKNQEFSVIL